MISLGTGEITMYYRFTKEVHIILELAYLETKNFDHREIATVHLLLGLIRQGKGLVAHILRDAGVTLENARLEVEKIQGPGTGSYKEIPYNQHTREVLELSKTEAEQLKDSEIDTQHLLLGLLRESKGGAIKVLQNLGVDPTYLRNQVFCRLAEQGHPIASLVPTAINPNGTNLNNAHLAVIEKILQHPEGPEAIFVKNNPGIIDSELIKNMASILEQQGDTKGAKVLRGLIFPQETTDELLAPPENPEPVVDVLTPQELDQFLYQLLRVSFESKADEQEKVVHNFLRQNLEKLSDRFPEVLQNWADKTLTKVGDAKKKEFLNRVTAISSLIRTFDGGVRGTNLEIALTGYSIVASFLTPVETPEDWAIIHNCLGLTYLERVQGERGENLKEAIADFTIALDFYNQEQFPDQRKIILENVEQAGTKLRNMLGKEEEENEEREIASSSNFSSLDTKEQRITHENSERSHKYLYLIEELLRSLQSQHESILDYNSELVDTGLIEMMRQRAEAEENMGNIQNAELLNSIADKLKETLSSLPSSLPLSSGTLELNNAIAEGADRSDLIQFIQELLSLIFNYDANSQYVYPYLRSNLNLLNDGLIDILQNVISPELRVVSLEDANEIAYSLGSLGTLLIHFDYGHKPTNIEIAITSLKISASIYEATKNIDPKNWILTQGELAKAYRNRIIGNKEDNIETSISLFLETLKFLDKNSIEAANCQYNLAVAYIHRIKESRKDNFSLAEECLKKASTIYLEQGFTDEWAGCEYNFGCLYYDFIRLKLEEEPEKITELREKSIQYWENVLQVWKRLSHGKKWGDTQYNLAQAYNERQIGDPIENQQRSIFHYKQALEFRTIEDYPDSWAVTQKDLANAYREMGTNQTNNSQRIQDFQQAIQHYQESLKIYTESKFSELREVVLNQIKILQQYCNPEKLPTDNNEDTKFFTELLVVCFRYKNSFEYISTFFEYISTFFEENLQQFDETFAQRFENWVLTTFLCEESFEENNSWNSAPKPIKIRLLNIFAMNILQFTKGDRSRNIEIAINVLELITELWKKENNLDLWANSQWFLGEAYREHLRSNHNHNLLKSVNCFDNALQVFTITNSPERWAVLQRELATTYEAWLGEDREKNLLKAIECYQQVCRFYTPDKDPEKWAWHQIYIAIVYQKFVTEEAKYLEQAKQCAEQSVKVLSNKPEYQESWAKAIINLGVILTRRIEGDKATNQEEAIKLYKQSSKILTKKGFSNEWAVNQHNLAKAYLFRINGKKSENIEEAIKYCENVLSVLTRQSNPEEWGKAIRTMGMVYFQRLQGDPIANREKALDYYNQALNVFNQENDSQRWAEIQVNLAAVYIERKSSDLQKNLLDAISCCEQALLVYTKDRYPMGWANAHSELAIAHKNLGNWGKAIEASNRALEVCTSDKFSQRYITTNNNLGAIYIDIAHSKSDLKSKLEDFKQAINCLEQVLQVAHQKGYTQDCANIKVNLSSCYFEYLKILESGHFVDELDLEQEKVVSFCQESLTYFQQHNYPEMVVKLYALFGKFYQNIQNYDLAYEHFARAIDHIEELRSDMISDEQSKQKWSAEYNGIYGYLISICLKLGETDAEYKKKAFEYSERNKARSLVELINSRDRYPDYLSAIEIERLKSLKQEIIRIQQRLYIDETYQLNNNVLNRTVLRQQLENLETQKNQIIKGKESNFSFQEEVKALNFQEIKSLLSNSETCALSWYFLENSLVTFIITPQLSEPCTLPLSDQHHQQFLKNILDWLHSYEELNKEKDETKRTVKTEEWIKSLSYRLDNLASSLMLHQIIDKLQELEKVYNTQYKKMLLIPHWFLHLIPIHALPLSKSTCLIDYFQAGVNYIPCCQLLDKISSYKKELNFNHFFAIQNPTKDLSFASLEVNIIENLVKSLAPNRKILPEDYATKINLYQSKELTVANCIHFSCHGQFITQRPLFSGLLLANEEFLTLGEIFELDLGNCYLITLSACKTGQVDYHTMSEYVGLPSAFLYAGCSSIVSSLWSVDEKATAFLLIKFYENLLGQLAEKSELNVAIALNQAQLWLRDVTVAELQKWASELKLEKQLVQQIQENLKCLITWYDSDEQLFQKPFYWAAFCAVGK